MKTINAFIVLIGLIALVSCSKDKAIEQALPNQPQQTITIPNGDFENWSASFDLQNWNTNSCPYCVPAWETYIVQKDPNVHHGQFSAKFIYNSVYASYAENKFPIPYHPSSLKGYVKCNLYGTDTVTVQIELFNNSVIVDSGQWLGTYSINNYLQFNIPITQNVSQADSALIRIQGGHKIGYPSNTTEVWVDDLTLQ